METAITLLKHLAEFGFSPLNVVLIAMIYFMGTQLGIFPKFWGDKTASAVKPASQESMDKLSSYYNHDTTELLTDIRDHLSDLKEETKVISANLTSLHITTNRLETTIREWERYGVPNGKKQ